MEHPLRQGHPRQSGANRPLETRHGLIEDTFPKIVDGDLWLRVQAAREARRGRGGHKIGAYVNLFASLGECVECGGGMRINAHGRTGYRYYECENHAVLKTCPNRCRYRVDILEAAVLDDLRWLSIAPPPKRAPAELVELEVNVKTLTAQKERLAKRVKTVDDDMYDLFVAQLRDVINDENDAKTRLAAAQQAKVVEAAPVEIGDLTDRPVLHTALKQRLEGVYFGDGNEVMIVTHGGALGMVVARQNAGKPYWFIRGADGRAALVSDGKLAFVDAPAGMPQLDRHTADDLLRHLRRSVPH